jgi:NAD-dependent deacetylase
MIDNRLKQKLVDFARSGRQLTVLTGAGISVESDIPTFRGAGGYWQVGSKEYKPQEIATRRMFEKRPDDVWAWYLFRRGVCRKARPNRGHLALVELERLFQGRFTLITQNVDGLHARAGSDPKQLYEIHGNIFHMRCDRGCSHAVYPIPDEIPAKRRGEPMNDGDRRLLTCPSCGHPARPHILWFDESYNEEYYHYVSALKTSTETGLLLVVGTSGSTNLPVLIAQKALRRDALIVDVNIRENPFSEVAVKSGGGFIQGTCSEVLPALLKVLGDAVRDGR